MPIESFLPLKCATEIFRDAGSLMQRQRGFDHCGVIGGEPWIKQLSIPPGMTEPITSRHAALDESECPLSDCEPMGLIQGYAGICQRCDHQAVPIRQHLVVQPRPNALVAYRKELTPQAGKADVLIHFSMVRLAAAGMGRVASDFRQPVESVKDILPFEISLRGHVITMRKIVSVVGTENFLNFGP